MTAPRCPACGQYMEKVKSYNRMVTYQCCGIQQNRSLNAFTADLMRYKQ